MVRKIRETAKSVDGVENVHEIIVHDYGSLYMISLHTEIPAKFRPAEMHEIAERCERKLRKHFGGEVVCHTDPLLEKTPEIQAIEDRFQIIVKDLPKIIGYHDFRVIAESSEKVIIAADIDVAEDVPETNFELIRRELAERIIKEIPNIAYSTLYVTPKYSY